MAKRNKKCQKEYIEERNGMHMAQRGHYIADRRQSARPLVDIVYQCDVCGREMRIWDTGYIAYATPCCLANLHSILLKLQYGSLIDLYEQS